MTQAKILSTLDMFCLLAKNNLLDSDDEQDCSVLLQILSIEGRPNMLQPVIRATPPAIGLAYLVEIATCGLYDKDSSLCALNQLATLDNTTLLRKVLSDISQTSGHDCVRTAATTILSQTENHYDLQERS